MEAAAPVIDRVVGSLLTRITKELGYWVSSRKNVDAMKKEMERLQDASKEIEKQNVEREVKGSHLPAHVSTWLKQVDGIRKEVERIPADGIGIGCFNIKMRYKAGKDSSDILDRMSQVKDIPHLESPGEKILARVPSKYQASISGTVDGGTQNSSNTRDVIFEQALKCLEPENITTQMIALCGMGGVGKTHMMERLKKHVEDANMFKWVVKVVVGQKTDLYAIQHAVAEKTGGALNETTSDARAERLQDRFTTMSKNGEMKILVILDDIWKVLDLKDIGLSSSPLPNGFKLLITSRDKDVCAQMGVDTDCVFKIGALNDDEAKSLFFETVGVSKDDHPDLGKTGEEIIKRCGNLPIALKTIASTLKGKENSESAWIEALSRLQQHDLEDHYGTVHKVFEISYNYLKRKDEKALFLLSGLFPDDFDIPIEELIRYGWGLKLFSKVPSLAKARVRVQDCVDNLISANLLAESDRVGCVIMHDLARSFVLSNSTEIKQASIVNQDDISQLLTNESYQRILLKFTAVTEFPNDFNYPNLAFFKVTGGVEQLNFPDDFYKNMEKLEVLSYEEMEYPPLPPRLNQSSTNLRTLCLHGCKLTPDWSVIGDLDSLEVLSFADSQIKRLPSFIGKLKKLKLLDLNGCLDLHIDDGVFRNLDKLQELYMRVSGRKAINFTDANCDELGKLSIKLSALEVEFFGNHAQPKNMSFKNLERFKISIGCQLEDEKDVYSFQNTLKLESDSSDLLDFKINELFKKTEKFYLEVKDMKHLKDISMHPLQDSFSRLRVLEVGYCKELRYLFTVAMANGLRNLEHLTVHYCSVLESLIHGEEGENDRVIKFEKLKFLSLEYLPQLGSLSNRNKIIELPQLAELTLRDLPKFTSMQQFFNKEIDDAWTHPSQHPYFSLRVLDVHSCEELRYLFTVAIASGFRKLESLKVCWCRVLESLIHGDESENDGVIIFQELKFLSLQTLPKLGGLCDIDKVVELPQLTELELDGLHNFTSIYPDSAMQPFLNKQVAVPKLEKLKISFMFNLKQIWPSEITSGEEVHISMVRVVEVKMCYSLVNLFPINPMPLLRNLEKLEVEECDSIEVLFNIDLGRVGKVEEVSSSLRSIHVNSAGNLKEAWRIKGTDNNSQVSGFQAVENIRIHSCWKFRYVFTPITTNFDMRAHLDTDSQGSSAIIFYEALRSLQPNNKATTIAFCVMGSVGKTGMKEDLIKAVENQRNFDLVVKLDTGREDNTIALQQATAEYIGEALTETTIEARANSLHKRFMQVQQEGKKNILVILDDLWKVLDLKHIGLSSSPLPNGFRLLIISRDENVCIQMGVEKSSILRLGDLDDNDAEEKTLFFETVGLSKDDDPDLHKIGEEIRMICVKSPLALEAIAPVLKANIKDKSKWEEALSRLQNHDLEENYDLVSKITFEMSNNNLKTDDEKAILFLCSFFPKCFVIPVEELMSYAWGLKLFPEVCTLAQARHRTKASVDGLMHANFLTESNKSGLVTMWWNAHDYVLSKFTEVKQASFGHGNIPEGDADESYERIFLDCGGTSEFDVDFNYPNLKLLKLKGEEKLVNFPQDFYDRMKNLEVVAYDKMVDPLLPSYSINLRTLCLNSCSFTGDFSFPGNLMNLEILSFADCKIQKLPSTIGKLKRLKVLKVTGFVHELCVEDGVFQNLVNLEELYMFGDGTTHVSYEELEILLRQLCVLEIELDKNKLHMKDGSFEKLEKFRISMGCRLGSHFYIQNDSENTLELVTNLSEVVECKMNELFEKTERLYLQVKDMKNLENYSFCNLRELMVSDCTDLTFLFTVQVASGLTKLEHLEVTKCPVLQTLIHGSESGVAGITFPKLRYLELKELPRLMSLCDTENIRVELQQLVELKLDFLPNFTSIYPDDDAMEANAFLNKQVEIPNLESLSISYMEKLKQIWRGGEISATRGSEKEGVNNNNNNISKLRKITVVGCDSLENLFPCNPLPLLNHLETLEVRHCCSIKVLFNMDLGGAGAGNMYQPTSSLRSIYVRGLENLREIWRIKGEGGNNNASSSGLLHIPCFQAVKEIHMWSCRRYRDIFAPKSINFDIRAQVHIED